MVFAAALALVCSAEGRGQGVILRNGLRADLVGCYALYSQHGRANSSPYSANSLYNASPSVRLDSQVLHSSESATLPGVGRTMVPLNLSNEPARPVQTGPWRPHDGRGSWSADSLTDTVRLSFVDGYSGAVFVLSARGNRPDTLRGRVFVFWDTGPTQTNHGPARAVRQSCAPRR